MSIELVLHNMVGYDDGRMHFEGELRALNRIADGVTDGVIVSIGSYRGQADCALALHAHVPVYCIDPRQGWAGEARQFGDQDRDYWMQNVMSLGLASKVRPIELPSVVVAELWDQSIGLLFIDGNHIQIAGDLDAWLLHVVPGGLIAVHDNDLAIIIQAVTARNDMVEIEHADLTTVYRKERRYERYEYNGLALDVRTNQYGPADCHAVQEVQDYALPDFPLRTAIDAGAHIGAFTAHVKRQFGDARVLAIEPEPGNYALLQRNTANLDGVTALNAALSYDPTLTSLVVDPINSGGHHLVHLTPVGAVPAPLPVTLDELLTGDFERVDLLKIDTEGSEMDVLLHAADDTLRRIHFITGERHYTHEDFLPAIDRLTALGFSVEDWPHPALSAPPWNMADRGLFTALNSHWLAEDEPLLEYGVPLELGDVDLTADMADYRKPPKVTVKRKPTSKAAAKKGGRR